ncbi:MAG: dihydropteroate synthase-like protein [Promethearchaeota archaeon]
MRILLVTGHLAEPLIRHAAQTIALNHFCDVLVLPQTVAAFLHPKYVAAQLGKQKSIGNYDLILLPGMVSGDTILVREATKIPSYKGTRHAADLPILLNLIAQGQVSLSTTEPADYIITEERTNSALKELDAAEKGPLPGKHEPKTICIDKGRQSLFAGPNYPMRIIAEIIDAPQKTDQELCQLASYFYSSGANIIDIGMIANIPDSQAASHIIKIVRKAVPIPISIDSTDPKELIAGIEAGATFVISLDQDNMTKIPPQLRKHAAFTVIPAAQSGQSLPKAVKDRVQLLTENLRIAEKLGYTTLIADPLCDPIITPGLTQAIQAYTTFAKEQPNIPLLMGIGNVTELLDADTPGANAVLAGIATEIGATFLLTTEASQKTRGSVWELYRASQMMYLAQRRQAHPKDLGIDLLLLKTKRFPENPYSELEDVSTQDVSDTALTHKLDPSGYFTFHIDRQKQCLVARHYPSVGAETPDAVFAAGTAKQILAAILAHETISRLDHATYIGFELAKAEIALITGRPYIQDEPLFTRWSPAPKD